MRNPKMIKVSVVVPVYNAGEYLEPCITSLLGQTMPADELELIFVDDGSTDDSLTRLNRLAAEHSHVRVISIENSGWPGKPRNIGSTAARGDYVQFVDQDDYLGLEALARTHALAAASGADVAIGKMVGVGRWTPTRLFRETRTDATLDNCDLVASLTPHKMFRRQFLLDQDILFPEGKRRLEDFVFVMRCYVAAQAICVLADYPCYFYTRRADGQNTSFQRIEPDVYFENLSEVIDVVYAAIPEGSRRDAVLERFYRSEILRRLSEPNVLTTPEDFVHELFRSSRKAAADLFADSTRRSLAPVLRARAELLRRGSALELVEFAQRLSGIKASVSATKAVWRGETLRVHVEAKLVLNGRPLRIVDGADGLVLDPALTDGLPEARPLIVGENADNVRDGVSLELLIRDRDTSIDWPVPCNVHVELARMEGLKGSRFAVVRGYCDLDPTTLAGGLPLVRGSWDVSVRVSMWGLHRTTRLAVGDGLELETLVRLVGSPAVSVLPYATAPHGNLTLDVGHRRKRIQLPAAVKIETSTTDGAVRSMVRRVLPSRLRRAIHRAR